MSARNRIVSLLILFVLCMALTALASDKPSPDAVIKILDMGNQRFVSGQAIHPHTGSERIHQAGVENQGDHAIATVITCSDSRVPVERLFDTGVMDVFVIRVAGNVVDVDEAGSIEYGLAHVKTPLMVVLGHTQCGAVTAVTHALHGQGHALEINIPPLVDNIIPAVKRAISMHGDVHGDIIIPYAIVENVWQGVEDLFMRSPTARNLVDSGQVKVVGAIYDVGTGRVEWLPEASVTQILRKVASNPDRQLNAMADSDHGATAAHGGVHEQDGETLSIKAVPVSLADAGVLNILKTDFLDAHEQTVHQEDIQVGIPVTAIW